MTTPSDTGQLAPGLKSDHRAVAKNAAYLFIGRLVSAFSLWMALIVLAKLSDPETVGKYALAQAVCIPIAEVAKLGLREVRSSDVIRVYRTTDHVVLRSFMVPLGIAAMVWVAFLQNLPPDALVVILIYALARSAYLMSDVIHAEFQAAEKMIHIGRSLCLVGPLSLVALGVGYYLTGSLALAVAGQAFMHFAVLLLHDVPIGFRVYRAQSHPHEGRLFQPRKIGQLFVKSLPLAFASALVMFALFFPRLSIANELGVAALGIAGPILSLVMAPDRLITSIGQAASVELARNYQSQRVSEYLSRLGLMAGIVLALGLPSLAVCHFYGEQILRAVYTSEHAQHGDLLVVLALAALIKILANVLSFGVIAARRFWWMSGQNLVVALVALVASLLLIGDYGLMGAGVCILIIFTTQFVGVVFCLSLAVRRARDGRL